MFENFQEEVIETLAIVDSNMWNLLSDRSIGICVTKSNSVGFQSSLDPEISYNRAWLNVYHIAYLKESLISSTNKGVSRVILNINKVIHHIRVDIKPMHMAPFKDGFLFTTSSDGYLLQL